MKGRQSFTTVETEVLPGTLTVKRDKGEGSGIRFGGSNEGPGDSTGGLTKGEKVSTGGEGS